MIDGNDEKYFSFYNYINSVSYYSNDDGIEFVDGKKILGNARAQYENYLNTPSDFVGVANNNIDIDDDEITEDNTPDPFPPTNEEDVVYEDVIEEPVTDSNTQSDENVTYDYDSVVGNDSEPNPKTGNSMSYAIAAVSVLGMVCIIGLTKKRNSK